MTITGKIGSISMEGERAHTAHHPPILQNRAVKAANGVYPAGLIASEDANGDLVPYTGAETGVGSVPVCVIDEPVDTATETSVQVLVHGTVKESLLTKDAAADPAEAADIRKLMNIGIYAV